MTQPPSGAHSIDDTLEPLGSRERPFVEHHTEFSFGDPYLAACVRPDVSIEDLFYFTPPEIKAESAAFERRFAQAFPSYRPWYAPLTDGLARVKEYVASRRESRLVHG